MVDSKLKSFRFLKTFSFSVFLLFLVSVAFIIDEHIVLLLILAAFFTLYYLIVNNFALNHFHLVILLLIVSLLAPPIEISTSFPKIRPEEFFFYLLFPILLITQLKHMKFNTSSLNFIWIFFFFLFTTLLSTTYGKFFLNVPVGMRDFFELITLSKYLLVYIVVSNFTLTKKELGNVFWIILILIAFSGLFGLVQYFGILSIDEFTAPIYLSERAYIVNDRLTGTFKNPNSYSVVLVLGHVIASVLLMFEKNRSKKVFLIFFIVFFLICLLFSNSRTMIAAYLFITSLLFLAAIYFRGVKVRYLLFIFGIMIIITLGVISTLSDQFILRLKSGTDILGDESFGMRVIIWFLNLKLFLESPFLGWGPAKDLYTTIVDSEYILILRRYGILGFIFYLMLFLYPLYVALKSMKKRMSPESLIISIAIITFLITCLTNSILHNIQTMDFWIVLLALFLGEIDAKESNHKSNSQFFKLASNPE
ncbi:MAG: O-antigen ligase family protein [Balneola sp.]